MSPEFRELSPRAVDCLKIIYKLGERGEKVSTSAMRERLQALEPSGQLSDASVTQLFKWLAEQGYVRHMPYHGVELAERGKLVAAELVRHHRLIELFLMQVMGYRLDEVDAEAERLEHAISERFEDALDTLLGHPTEDPHGDPIPSKTGEVTLLPMQRLSELALGQDAIVRRVNDDNAARLRYLAELGLTPGASVRVIERAPFGGPLRIRVGRHDSADTADTQTEYAVGPELAADVQVALAGAH